MCKPILGGIGSVLAGAVVGWFVLMPTMNGGPSGGNPVFAHEVRRPSTPLRVTLVEILGMTRRDAQGDAAAGGPQLGEC